MGKEIRYPVYIVSKGRSEKQLTAKALKEINIPFYVIVEEHDYDKYAKHINRDSLLILPPKYLSEYDTFDDLGETKSKGPGAARNFAWEHSMNLGAARHWVLDDNIDGFFRLNENEKVRVKSNATFRAAEDFVDRYENIYIAGFNYFMFCKATDEVPPFILNTRIYSHLLIKNDIPYRWRGRYNEDTDLSLRVLKDGHCTVQFNAFLSMKAPTQTIGGGNTEEFYSKEGTYPKSKMLEDMHPDVAKVTFKFNRWHHHVDYSIFKRNLLKFKSSIAIPNGTDNYGMTLKKKSKYKESDESSKPAAYKSQLENGLLFGSRLWWEEHWQGMPEFNQKKQEAYSTITVRFRNKKDMENFAQLIGQTVNNNSSLWHPKLQYMDTSNKSYEDEEGKV